MDEGAEPSQQFGDILFPHNDPGSFRNASVVIFVSEGTSKLMATTNGFRTAYRK